MVFWTKPPTGSLSDNNSDSANPTNSVTPDAKPSILGESPVVTGEPRKAAPEDAPKTLEDQLVARFGKLRSALGVGTVIQGKLSFDTPVRIDGKLSGEVFSSDAIIVGPSGRIDAQIEAAYLIVLGTVTGAVKASKKIELYAGGKIQSDISTPSFMMEEGANFDGKCAMGMGVAQATTKITHAEEAKRTSPAPTPAAPRTEPAPKVEQPKADQSREADKQPAKEGATLSVH